MQLRKVRVAEVERVRRTMVDVPEHQAEEVTLAQAVRMLFPEIRAMQSKGYGLPAVAEHLKENGLALSTKTLKAYLKEAGAGGGRSKPRNPKVRRSETADAPAASAASTGPSKLPLSPSTGSPGAQQSARVTPRAAPPAPTPPTASAPSVATKASPGAPRSGEEAGTRRSSFVPKEDTRDI
jgi:hypothetical protein